MLELERAKHPIQEPEIGLTKNWQASSKCCARKQPEAWKCL